MTVALETPEFVWYLMRGSGLVALLLLSVTTALGVVGVTRWQSGRWPRLVSAGLHRNASLLAVCFLSVHVVTALLDSWVGLRWIGVLVPFQSHYRPLWVGMGVLASDLVLAVIATSLLRSHIGHAAWRLVHWAAWLMWPVAIAHVLGAGTDVGTPIGATVTVVSVAMVLAALAWRLASAPAPPPVRDGTPPRPTTRRATRPLTTTGGSS